MSHEAYPLASQNNSPAPSAPAIEVDGGVVDRRGPTDIMTEQAVLLIGFGGPTRSDEIRPFLDNVLRGRRVPRERIEEVAHHYELIGGRSPFNELTFRQAEGLRRLLEKEGPPVPVYVGMRNWHPLLAEVLERMAGDGVRRAVGVILAPHQGEASWGRYQEAVREARISVEEGLGRPAPTVDYCEPWFAHPDFVEAVADRVRRQWNQIPSRNRLRTRLLFTAHSVPSRFDRPYVDQLRESCRAVASVLGISKWDLVYQSRSGGPRDPWLEPDVCDVIESLGKKKCPGVLLAPIGFVCDHVEVLYDLDVEAREAAARWKMEFYRAQTVNDHPRFIRMLADVVRRALGGGVASGV